MSSGETSPPAGADRRVRVWIAIGLFLGTFLLYVRTLPYPFTNLDDPVYVSDNQRVLDGLTADGVRWAFTTWHAGYWQPVTWLSFQLDATLFDPHSGTGYRLTNILLHSVNAVLVFGLLAAATGCPWRSAAAAALWAAHPLRVESVVWVTERKDVLSTLFALLAVWAYGCFARRPGLGRYALVAGLFAVGLAAKAMIVTLPFALLLLDYWPLGRTTRAGWGRLAVEKLPLIAIAAGFGVLTLITQAAAGGVPGLAKLTVENRVSTALMGYATYIVQTVWPSDLGLFYPYRYRTFGEIAVIAAAAGLVTATAAVLWWRRDRPYLLVGWLWFLGTLVPVIGLVQAGDQARADRFTYLPAIGLTVAVVWGAADMLARWVRLPDRVTLGWGLATAAVLGLGLTTWSQCYHWRDRVSIWDHTLRVTGEFNPTGRVCMGQMLNEAGRYEEALGHFIAAAAQDPKNASAHFQAGSGLVNFGRFEEAVPHYETVVQLFPDSAVSRSGLGYALARLGRADEAYPHLLAVSSGDTPELTARLALGQILLGSGRYAAATDQYGRAADLSPNSAAVRLKAGTAALAAGRLADADRHLGEAIRRSPADPEPLALGGVVAWRQGKTDEATGLFTRAVAADPRSVLAGAGLGVSLIAAGRRADAAREFARLSAVVPSWKTSAVDTAARPEFPPPAAECLLRAVGEASEYTVPPAVFGLVTLLAADGRAGEAEQILGQLRDAATAVGNAELIQEVDARREKLRAAP